MSDKALIAASVYLKGDLLKPDVVTATLGFEPDRSRTKGEKRGGERSRTKTYVAKTGLWVTKIKKYPIAGRDVFYEVPVVVDELLQRFKGRQDPLDQITSVEEAFLDILILGNAKDTADFMLSKAQIARAGQLGLAISVTTSMTDDE
jgi:hypothetical protein